MVPRTPWGDPDLQGQWNSQTSTPLERPRTGPLAGKETLTDEEAESVEEANLARGDAPPAAGDPGTYNSFWFDRGKGLNRPSLILDPPDGRVPAYTPEAEQRLAAERAERATRGPADSYADLPIWTRCITRGWNGIGSNYSSNTQIFQSPGYVVVLQELIHEPRIIPLDGRDRLPARREAVARRVTRALGGRHARRRDAQLRRALELPRIVHRPRADRALHAHVGRRDRLPLHDARPGDLREGLDRGAPDAPRNRERSRSSNTPATKATSP